LGGGDGRPPCRGRTRRDSRRGTCPYRALMSRPNQRGENRSDGSSLGQTAFAAANPPTPRQGEQQPNRGEHVHAAQPAQSMDQRTPCGQASTSAGRYPRPRELTGSAYLAHHRRARLRGEATGGPRRGIGADRHTVDAQRPSPPAAHRPSKRAARRATPQPAGIHLAEQTRHRLSADPPPRQQAAAHA
jgi:hypothetical protein